MYLWNASNENITLLTTLTDESDYASSVQWNAKDPSIIAVGTYSGRVQIFDTTRGTLVRELAAHSARVPSLSWRNESFLSSGGRDSRIINYDTRSAAPIISSYAGHEQEICGLSWSPDGTMLVRISLLFLPSDQLCAGIGRK